MERIGLLDIGDDYEEVEVRPGKALHVHGLNAEAIFSILKRYPSLAALFNRGSGLTTTKLFEMAPGAIHAAIAASTGNLDDLAAEKKAASLPIDTQHAIIKACLKLTFVAQGGFGPFVQSLRETSESFALTAQAGNGLDTRSPRPSSSSSTKDTHAPTSGA